MVDVNVDKVIIRQQQNEIDEHFIYKKLAQISKDSYNKKVLEHISKDELDHYKFWRTLTKKEIRPQVLKVNWYVLLSRVFGLSFGLKLMEGGEKTAQKFYAQYETKYPQIKKIKHDESMHEKQLLDLLHDQKLNYAGAVVLGLNDALVELTGTLAGLTLAFANSKIIGVTGLIMGIAASLSMAASAYLSFREQENSSDGRQPLKSSLYTGLAYLITVALLVFPYFIFQNVYHALVLVLIITILIIAGYNFYISIAKELNFRRRFLEMAMISLGVALISFGIGYFVKTFFGIQI